MTRTQRLTTRDGENYLKAWDGVFSVRKELVAGVAFEGSNAGERLSRRRYTYVRFCNVIFSNATLDRCEFAFCVFEDCSFVQLYLATKAVFDGCWFERCHINHVRACNEITQIYIKDGMFIDSVINELQAYQGNSGSSSFLVEGTSFKNTKVVTSFGLAYLYRNKGLVDAGMDKRGYRFLGVWYADHWYVSAGCRWYPLPDAKEHWDQRSNNDALLRVQLIAGSPNPLISTDRPYPFNQVPVKW